MSFFNLTIKKDLPIKQEKQLPSVFQKKASMQLPSNTRKKAKEKLLFLQRVCSYSYENGVGENVASATVALDSNDFPLLGKSGKGGKTALHYSNFRNWILACGRLKNRMPDPAGLDKLLDNYHVDKYVRKGDDIFWETFFRMYLNDEQIPLTKAYKKTCSIFVQSPNSKIPTLAQVKHYMTHKFPKASEMIARKGATWASDRLGGFVRRDWSSIEAGRIWVGDHHKLDMYVKVWDEEKQKYIVKRPWLTAWMDIRSLYFVGFYLSVEDPNSVTIMRALAAGYLVAGGHGPQTLYSDNGKDFKRMGLAEPVIFGKHKHSACIELGVEPTFSLPYNGRAKPIERIFKEVSHEFCKMENTYLGSNIWERPETSSYYESHPEDAPDIESTYFKFFDYIQNTYHQKKQSGKIIGVDEGGLSQSPASAWMKRTQFGKNWESLYEVRTAMRLPLLQTRKVGQGYCVRINGEDYRAKGKGESLNLYYNKNVMIKIDVFSEEYFAYTTEGGFICELEKIQSVKAMYASFDDEQSKLLSEEMAWARRTTKWAMAQALDATGLPCLVSASTAIDLLDVGAELKLVGEKRSVKGSSHKYQHHEVITPSATVALHEIAKELNISATVAQVKIDNEVKQSATVAQNVKSKMERLRALKLQQAINKGE